MKPRSRTARRGTPAAIRAKGRPPPSSCRSSTFCATANQSSLCACSPRAPGAGRCRHDRRMTAGRGPSPGQPHHPRDRRSQRIAQTRHASRAGNALQSFPTMQRRPDQDARHDLDPCRAQAQRCHRRLADPRRRHLKARGTVTAIVVSAGLPRGRGWMAGRRFVAMGQERAGHNQQGMCRSCHSRESQ